LSLMVTGPDGLTRRLNGFYVRIFGDEFSNEMRDVDYGGCFYIKKNRNQRQMRRTDRYLLEKVQNKKDDKTKQADFHQGIEDPDQILPDVKIAAAGQQNRTNGGNEFAFKPELALSALVLAFFKLVGTARTEMDSIGKLDFGAGQRNLFLEQGPDFFSFGYGNGPEFFGFSTCSGVLNNQGPALELNGLAPGVNHLCN